MAKSIYFENLNEFPTLCFRRRIYVIFRPLHNGRERSRGNCVTWQRFCRHAPIDARKRNLITRINSSGFQKIADFMLTSDHGESAFENVDLSTSTALFFCIPHLVFDVSRAILPTDLLRRTAQCHLQSGQSDEDDTKKAKHNFCKQRV